MCEHRTPFVQQIVDAELDSSLDDPSQGPIVVVYDVVDEEGIVELQAF